MKRSVILGIACFLLSVLPGQPADRPLESAATRLRAAGGPAARLEVSTRTGAVTFFAADRATPVPVLASPSASPDERARIFLSTHGNAFGLASDQGLELRRTRRDDLGIDHLRYQQTYAGIPVTGGEIMVHLRGDSVVAANSKLLAGLAGVATTPTIPAGAALATAREVLRKHLGITDSRIDSPRLEIFNQGLLEDRTSASRLAWFVEAASFDRREYFWIDALRGSVLLHFNQQPHARYRTVFDANDGSALPGTFVREEGDPPTGDADTDNAYLFAGHTYDYFWSEHGRDSYDDAGGEIRSTVHFCPSPDDCPMANAFWNGIQMVYGESFASVDDIVAHELTHAVQSYTADLYYYMQSGALNESFSDIFGETVDLLNGVGTDTPGARWFLGEDAPGGPARDMMIPTDFGDPGKVSDPEFKCYMSGWADNGGVHSNSGVPNHAYMLMVDGGTYNGYSISGIGLTKAGKIQYRALNEYLLSASGFLDYYYAVDQACRDLVGTAGITGANCGEVTKSMQAVELHESLPCQPLQATVPALCPPGQAPVYWTSVDFETSFGFPACPAATVPTTWCDNGPTSVIGGSFATSGSHSLWGYNWPYTNDQTGWIGWGSATLPSGARLQFNHSFGFEDDLSGNYDGGVVEYSTNGGASWFEAAPLFAAGASYNGLVSNCCGNPLANRSAFVAESWGFTATQLNLSSLAGQTFNIRFRIGTDSSLDDRGWFVDDLSIYQCVFDPSIFSDDFESGNRGAWSATAP